MATNSVTLILKSGGSVVLTSPFMAGPGIAGDTAGVTRWYSDHDIEQMIITEG